MIRVSRQQIEEQINLLKVKVELQQRFCHALKERGTWERSFISLLVRDRDNNIQDRDLVNRYLAAHKAHYQAQTDAADIALAEMKSQLAISEAMLAEAKNPSVIVPGGISHAN